MRDDFGRAMAFTWPEETGHNPKNPRGNVDDPKDYGGRTSRGIRQRTYDSWCAEEHLPLGDVWEADDGTLRNIYRAWYWNAIRGDELPWPLCAALFDTAVLHSPAFAIARLQGALNECSKGSPLGPEQLALDGRFGPQTMGALKRAVANVALPVLVRMFLQARDDRYEGIVAAHPEQVRFYFGWEDRCDRLCDLCGVARTADPPTAPRRGGKG